MSICARFFTTFDAAPAATTHERDVDTMLVMVAPNSGLSRRLCLRSRTSQFQRRTHRTVSAVKCRLWQAIQRKLSCMTFHVQTSKCLYFVSKYVRFCKNKLGMPRNGCQMALVHAPEEYAKRRQTSSCGQRAEGRYSALFLFVSKYRPNDLYCGH